MLIESTCINANRDSKTPNGVVKIAQWQLELDQFIASTQLRLEQISASIAGCTTHENRCNEADDQGQTVQQQDDLLVEQVAEHQVAERETTPTIEDTTGESAVAHDELPSIPDQETAPTEAPVSKPVDQSSGIPAQPAETTTDGSDRRDADPATDDDPFARLDAIKRRLAQQLENS